MSRKHVTVITVLAMLTAIVGFLGLRFITNGHISAIDIVAVFVAAGVGMLAVWVTTRQMTHRQEAGGTLSSGKRKILYAVLAVCSLYCLLAIYGFFHRGFAARDRREVEEDVQRTLRLVRSKAGERDATGWVAARSADGRFAVMMPNLFNEINVKVAGQEFSSLIARFQGAKFTARAMPYKERGRELVERRKDFLEEMEQTRGGHAEIAEDGLYAERYPRLIMEGHVTADDSKGLAQVVLMEERGYMLTVEAQELTDALRSAASRFFESFEILAPDPNTAMAPDVGDAG